LEIRAARVVQVSTILFVASLLSMTSGAMEVRLALTAACLALLPLAAGIVIRWAERPRVG
jgi:hypothetical protein